MSSKAKKWTRHKGGGHGEPWLISYADLMTLLFGFFVILYTFSQVDQDKFTSFGEEMAETFGGKVQERKSDADVGVVSETRRLRALQMLVAILNLGKDESEAVRRIEAIAADSKEKNDAIKALSDRLKVGSAEELKEFFKGTGSQDRSIRIAVPNDLLFLSGSNQLTPTAQRRMRAIAGELAVMKDLLSVEVVGHTDSTPIGRGGRYANNFELSSARASAVAESLVAGGVKSTSIKAVGKGSSEPLFPEYRGDRTRIVENMSKNRRVEIIVTKADDQ